MSPRSRADGTGARELRGSRSTLASASVVLGARRDDRRGDTRDDDGDSGEDQRNGLEIVSGRVLIKPFAW